MNPRINVYWAGSLFNQKDLTGNLLLAKQVEEVSRGRYAVVLPQEREGSFFDAYEMRDSNYWNLIQCDAVIANFDGNDLDSGTVMEFAAAKMFDMPTVLLRTDFRYCADHGASADPWNLMCSHFPRTRVVLTDSMRDLHFMMRSSSKLDALKKFHQDIAEKTVEALELMLEAKPVAGTTFEEVSAHYRKAMQCLGGRLSRQITDSEFETMIRRKLRNGIYGS